MKWIHYKHPQSRGKKPLSVIPSLGNLDSMHRNIWACINYKLMQCSRKWNKKCCVKYAPRQCRVMKILGNSTALWYSRNFQEIGIIFVSRKCMKKYLCSLHCYFIFGCRNHARKPFKILIKVAIYAINPYAFLNQDCKQRTLNQKHWVHLNYAKRISSLSGLGATNCWCFNYSLLGVGAGDINVF